MDTEEKPGWAQGAVTVRTITPEIRKQVLNGWAFLSPDPIDHFTPEEAKALAFPPVFHIRKPTYLDSLQEIQYDPEVARQVMEAAEKAKVARNANGGIGAPAVEEPTPPSDEEKIAKMRAHGRNMIDGCRKYLTGWDWKTPLGEEIPFTKGPDGRISDESLSVLSRAWQMMVAIHLRVQSLAVLSDLEVEGFTSSPGSVTG